VVDPVSLGAITTGLIVKAVDRAEDDALDAGSGALRRLLGFVRDRFSRDGDAPASTALARVEDALDSPSRLRELAAVIAALAQRDEEFRTELERLVGEARQAGIEVGISQAATGNLEWRFREGFRPERLKSLNMTVLDLPDRADRAGMAERKPRRSAAPRECSVRPAGWGGPCGCASRGSTAGISSRSPIALDGGFMRS
jgi:hypothetical protein